MRSAWLSSTSFLVSLGVLCGSVAHAAPDAAWVARMDAMAIALSELSPLLVEGVSWDAATQERARGQIRALESVAHGLAAGPGKRFPDTDPTLPLLTRELAVALDDAKHAAGDKLKSDALLVVATCIGCHTRGDLGAPRPTMTLPPIKVADPWLKADILLATRRFDEARAAYKSVVGDEAFAQKNPYLWERAVKRALVLEVRTLRDPRRALEVATTVINTPGGEPLWRDAAEWERDIKSWMTEPTTTPSPDALYRQAQRLMDTAIARAPGDSGGDVVYLRATALLHRLLAHPLDAPRRAQALSWLAIAYEALRDVDVWSLFLIYNEACVEAAPRTPIAAECYSRLERLLFVEHTGSAGGPLPDPEQKKLARLKGLTLPAAPQTPSP